MASQKRVGVVLSGCGFLDGAEIQEAICTLLSLDRRGAKLVAMAPDVEQMHVVDHVKGAPAEGQRGGCSRRPRGSCAGRSPSCRKVSAKDLDALVFPGGYGVGEEPLLVRGGRAEHARAARRSSGSPATCAPPASPGLHLHRPGDRRAAVRRRAR